MLLCLLRLHSGPAALAVLMSCEMLAKEDGGGYLGGKGLGRGLGGWGVGKERGCPNTALPISILYQRNWIIKNDHRAHL